MKQNSSSQRREKAKERAIAIPNDKVSWFISQLMEWFRENGRRFEWRRDDYPLYKVIISELLLQRTRAETVDRFIEGFFEIYPNWKSIAHSDLTTLQEALKPFGLWLRRAATFYALSIELESRDGVLPKDSDSLMNLSGLGPYIVSAILLYRDGAPEPLLDGGMARLLERFFGPRELVDIRHDPFLNTIASRVLQRKKVSPKSLNWSMLDVAAKICTPSRPKCDLCPLSERCPSSTYR